MLGVQRKRYSDYNIEKTGCLNPPKETEVKYLISLDRIYQEGDLLLSKVSVRDVQEVTHFHDGATQYPTRC